MNQETEAKYAESYRIGYKNGYNQGIADTLLVFRDLMSEHNLKIEDKEFYLALEDLKK